MLSGIERDFHANHLPRIRDILLFFFSGGQLRDTEGLCFAERKFGRLLREEGGGKVYKN